MTDMHCKVFGANSKEYYTIITLPKNSGGMGHAGKAQGKKSVPLCLHGSPLSPLKSKAIEIWWIDLRG